MIKFCHQCGYLCLRSVRALRKTMEEHEPTAELFTIKSGSGRKRKTDGIEAQVWAELDTSKYHTHKVVSAMLKEKFDIDASVNLAGRLVKRWKLAREQGAK